MSQLNPFNPSFGRVPRIYIDRDQTVKQLEEDIQDPQSPYLTTLIYGMRGSGKTTMLTDISHDMQKQADWIVVDLTMSDRLIPTLIESVYSQANKELRSLLAKISGVSLGTNGIKVDYDTTKSQVENSPHQVLLVEMAKMLKRQGKALLITIDEISSTPALREFAGIYQILLRNNYQIALLMAGLPNKVSELQNDSVLTFLLRSQRIYLEPLSLMTIKASYDRAFHRDGHFIDDQVLTRITKLTNGYAYAFQLLGFLLWRSRKLIIDDATVDSVIPQYQNELYRNVYVKMYQELSDKDREFVGAMAKIGRPNAKMVEIGQAMDKPKNYLSNYRRRLLDDQIIESKVRGEVSFTLPYFAEFVKDYETLY